MRVGSHAVAGAVTGVQQKCVGSTVWHVDTGTPERNEKAFFNARQVMHPARRVRQVYSVVRAARSWNA